MLVHIAKFTNMWQEDLTNSIRSLEQLKEVNPLLDLSGLEAVLKEMRLAITPHSLKLIDFSNPRDPLLLMSVPDVQELEVRANELLDPIGDDQKSPVKFLTHRYPNRVLIYPTFFCATYCRFCFRRFKTGKVTPGPSVVEMQAIFEYLRAHPEVREVIFSGGDPLILSDEQISEWLEGVFAIDSVKRVRFHTRVPVNLPSRITKDFCKLLKRFASKERPIYVVTHFNHPREIAAENVEALSLLADSGIVVRNQSVLLKDINDSEEVLAELFERLVDLRACPYYLHQLDLARGTNHFRVSIERGKEIMRNLQGRLSGLAVPRYMLDLPKGRGKIPLVRNYLREVDGEIFAEGPFGDVERYPSK